MIEVKFNKPFRGILVDGLAEPGDIVKIDQKKFKEEEAVYAEAVFLAALDCDVFEILKGEWK